MRLPAAAAALVLLGGCMAIGLPSAGEGSVRYVALGDSYTVGTSVSSAESWPSQLAVRVPGLELVANLGVNGYTSRDLIDDELPQLAALRPEFVTVMIGVNDVVQGVSEAAYASNVAETLGSLLALLPASQIVCIATPDYTVTPQGAAFGSPVQQRAGIMRVNELLAAACAARGISFVPEIFDISENAAIDRSLVAGDGLHPSGAQYRRWVDAIQLVVEELLAA